MSSKIMIIWGFLVVLLVTIIAYFGIKQDSNKDYIKMQNSLKTAVNKYIEYESIELPLEITSDELITKEYLDKLEYDNKTCSADVRVRKIAFWNNYKIKYTCSEK